MKSCCDGNISPRSVSAASRPDGFQESARNSGHLVNLWAHFLEPFPVFKASSIGRDQFQGQEWVPFFGFTNCAFSHALCKVKKDGHARVPLPGEDFWRPMADISDNFIQLSEELFRINFDEKSISSTSPLPKGCAAGCQFLEIHPASSQRHMQSANTAV